MVVTGTIMAVWAQRKAPPKFNSSPLTGYRNPIGKYPKSQLVGGGIRSRFAMAIFQVPIYCTVCICKYICILYIHSSIYICILYCCGSHFMGPIYSHCLLFRI